MAISISKRKRDELLLDPERRQRLHAHRNLNILSSHAIARDGILFAEMFTSGDILVWSEEYLLFVRDFLISHEPFSWKVPLPDCNSVTKSFCFDVRVGNDESRELLSYSKSGEVVIFLIELDGRISIFQHNIKFLNEEEEISSVNHLDDAVVIGSTAEEVYILKRVGKEFIETRLQKHHNILFGIVESSAKYLGFGSTGRSTNLDNNNSIKIITLSHKDGSTGMVNDLLIHITSSTIYLWSDWIQNRTGSEKLLMESNLLSALAHDSSSGSTAMSIYDVILLPRVKESSRAALLILIGKNCNNSSNATNSSQLQSTTATSLWLAVLEIRLVSPSTGSAGMGSERQTQPNIILKQSLCIATNISSALTPPPSLHGISNTTSKSATSCDKSHTSSWLAFVSWSSSNGSNNRNIESEEECTLKFGHYDIRSLPSVTNAAGLQGQLQLQPQPQPSMDTGIASHSVLSRCTVTGVDGVILVLKDGQILVALPPLSRPPRTQAISLQTDDRIDVTQLLSKIVFGQMSEDSLSLLRSLLSPLSSTQLSDVVTNISQQIADRLPIGLTTTSTTGWSKDKTGKDLSLHLQPTTIETAAATGSHENRYFTCQRSLTEKIHLFEVLKNILIRVDVWSDQSVVYAFSLNQQLVLGTYQLFQAIQELQQKATDGLIHSTSSITTTTMQQQQLQPPVAQGMMDAVELVTQVMVMVVVREKSSGLGGSMSGSSPTSVITRKVLETLEEEGLTVQDMFFAKCTQLPNKLVAFSTMLSQSMEQLHSRKTLLLAAYSICSLILSSCSNSGELVVTTSRSMATSSNLTQPVMSLSLSLVMQPKTREAILQSLSVLRQSIIETQKGYHTSIGAAAAAAAAGRASRDSGTPITEILRRDREGVRLYGLCHLLLQSYLEETLQVSESRDPYGQHMSTGWKHQFQQAKDCCISLLLQLGMSTQAFSLSSNTLHPVGLLVASDHEPTLRNQLPGLFAKLGGVQGSLALPFAQIGLEYLEESGRILELLELGKMCRDQLEKFLETRPAIAWLYYLSERSYAAASQAAYRQSTMELQAGNAKVLCSLASLCAYAIEGKESDISGDVERSLAVLRAQELVQDYCPEAIANDERLDERKLVELLVDLTSTAKDSHQRPLPVEDKVVIVSSALALLSMLVGGLEQTQRGALRYMSSIHDTWILSQLVKLWIVTIASDQYVWLDLAATARVDYGTNELFFQDTLLYAVLSSNWREVFGGRLNEVVLVDPRDKEFLLDRIIGEIFGSGSESRRLAYVVLSCIEEVMNSFNKK